MVVAGAHRAALGAAVVFASRAVLGVAQLPRPALNSPVHLVCPPHPQVGAHDAAVKRSVPAGHQPLALTHAADAYHEHVRVHRATAHDQHVAGWVLRGLPAVETQLLTAEY